MPTLSRATNSVCVMISCILRYLRGPGNARVWQPCVSFAWPVEGMVLADAFSSCALTGSLPASWAALTSLFFLSVSNTLITGAARTSASVATLTINTFNLCVIQV